MRHPTDGTLRRLLDEPPGVADDDREHVAGCATCQAGLAAAHDDAALAGAALDVDLAGIDLDAAWARFSSSLAAETRPRAAPAQAAAPGRRWRGALRSPRIAALAAGVVLAGGGAAAAASWLEIFHTEQVAPIRITQADLVRLPDLSSYGELDLVEVPEVREVDDVAAGEARTGLAVPEVAELPRGVTGEPTVQAGGRVAGVFTFEADDAERVAADSGEALPPPPAGLDGSRFRLSAGPGLALVWSEARGIPAMVVARSVAPTAESSGIPFETARDYLLSLPSLPEDVADQLRRFSADGETLPLPVPADEVTSEETDVDGVPATLLTTRDGSMAGVVWVSDGIVNAVAGTLSADEVLAVARDLRWGP